VSKDPRGAKGLGCGLIDFGEAWLFQAMLSRTNIGRASDVRRDDAKILATQPRKLHGLEMKIE